MYCICDFVDTEGAIHIAPILEVVMNEIILVNLSIMKCPVARKGVYFLRSFYSRRLAALVTTKEDRSL